MRSITENIKIKVNPEQSAIVQEICFKQGIDWHPDTEGEAKSVKFETMPALLIDAIGRYNEGKCLYWQALHDYNAERHTKEYTFEQFVQEFGEQPIKESAKLKPRKHAELIKAWAYGAVIQYSSDGKTWEDCLDNMPAWYKSCEYRIKPEPEANPIVQVVIDVTTRDTLYHCKTFNMKLSEIEEFINKHSNNTL